MVDVTRLGWSHAAPLGEGEFGEEQGDEILKLEQFTSIGVSLGLLFVRIMPLMAST